MNKKEIEKLLGETKSEINRILSHAMLFSTEDITKLDHLYTEMESLTFKLRSIGQEEESDGIK